MMSCHLFIYRYNLLILIGMLKFLRLASKLKHDKILKVDIKIVVMILFILYNKTVIIITN